MKLFARREKFSGAPPRRPQPEWPQHPEIALTPQQQETLAMLRKAFLDAVYKQKKISREPYTQVTDARLREIIADSHPDLSGIVTPIQLPDLTAEAAPYLMDKLDQRVSNEIEPKIKELLAEGVMQKNAAENKHPGQMSTPGYEEHNEGSPQHAARVTNRLYERERQAVLAYVYRDHILAESDSIGTRK